MLFIKFDHVSHTHLTYIQEVFVLLWPFCEVEIMQVVYDVLN